MSMAITLLTIELYPGIILAKEGKRVPTFQTRQDIPHQYKWNLESMYPSKKEWEEDVREAEELSEDFKRKYKNKLSKSPSIMKNAIEEYIKLSRIEEKAYVYAQLSFDVNQSNPKLQTMTDRSENMATMVYENTSWFRPEVVSIPKRQMKKYLKDPSLRHYKKVLSNIAHSKPHTLSKEMELLLAKISPLSSTGSNVYEMLEKDIQFPAIKDEKNQLIPLTRSNYPVFMGNKNRDIRKQAFHTYYRTLAKYQDSFAETLGAEVKADNIYANIRKYPSALEASLNSNHIPVEVYNKLIQSVHKGLPLLHRYVELKEKMLQVDDLHMYDIHVPIAEENDSYIPYEEAQKMVIEGLKPMGEEYVNEIKRAFAEGWVDVYATEDKRSGAYQWGAYDGHPYILLNYHGTKNDVYTLAHELGHAMNSLYSNKHQPYITSGYTIFTAEVASTLNEALLWNSEYQKAKTKKEKMVLLNQRLEDFRTTLFRQTQFAEFEKMIHDLEQKGESLNAEALKKIYGDLNKKYYGTAMHNDKEIEMEWARIPHFYNSFYVYQYATSFAASAALSDQIMKEGSKKVSIIKEKLLSAGGSKSPIILLKEAGIDMSTTKPIDQALEVFEETLDELEALLKEKS